MPRIPQLPPFIEILRPRQWLKNVIVLAGLAFALPDKLQQDVDFGAAVANSFAAFALFCIASSAVYIMNDLRDVEGDRAHPRKSRRPIASGRLAPRAAIAECALLGAAAFAGALFVGRGGTFALCLGAYFLMQAAYTFALKNVVLVDVFVVALGFVMRVYAGTAAAGVRASSWLLLCTFSVTLFIILCKRYDERTLLGADAGKHRKVLAHYEPAFLAHIITATAAVAIICYAIYTLSSGTVEKFGTEALVATVPFVIFGVYRYAYLVFCKGKGGHPEKVLTTDIPTLINLLLYAAACAAALFGRRIIDALAN